MRQRFFPTPEIDAKIKALYSGRLKRGDAARLASAIGWSREAVSYRAGILGVRMPKDRPWRAREIEILEGCSHLSPFTTRKRLKKAGYDRTPAAIMKRSQMIGLGFRGERLAKGIYTARQLAPLLGVSEATIRRWLRQGILRGKRRGTDRTEIQGGDEWEIQDADVRYMICNFTAEVEGILRRADIYWLVDVLTGARAKKAALEAAA